MKQILATLLAAVVLVSSFALRVVAVPTIPTIPTIPIVLESVRALQRVDPGSPTPNNHCTTFSVNTHDHTWVTVAHCLAVTIETHRGRVVIPSIAPRDYFIDGHPATILIADFLADIAVLQTADYTIPALHLAKVGPGYLAAVTTAGYPYGMGPTMNIGYVSHPSLESPRDKTYMIIAMTGCPGNSGSPILNSKNEVISISQTVVNSQGCSGMMGGAPYSDLVRVAGKYFQ